MAQLFSKHPSTLADLSTSTRPSNPTPPGLPLRCPPARPPSPKLPHPSQRTQPLSPTQNSPSRPSSPTPPQPKPQPTIPISSPSSPPQPPSPPPKSFAPTEPCFKPFAPANHPLTAPSCTAFPPPSIPFIPDHPSHFLPPRANPGNPDDHHLHSQALPRGAPPLRPSPHLRLPPKPSTSATPLRPLSQLPVLRVCRRSTQAPIPRQLPARPPSTNNLPRPSTLLDTLIRSPLPFSTLCSPPSPTLGLNLATLPADLHREHRRALFLSLQRIVLLSSPLFSRVPSSSPI